MSKKKIFFREAVNAEMLVFIDGYLDHLEFLGKSHETLASYRGTYYAFFSYCPKALKDIVYLDVRNWLEYYKATKSDMHPKTMNLRLSALKSFFKYWFKKGEVTKIPIKYSWREKVKPQQPKALSKADQAKLTVKSDDLNIRNRAMIAFLFSSGVRVSELVGLRICDINLKEGTARVIGKGEKEREVHFSKTCSFLLELYLTHPDYKPTSESQPLFRSFRRKIKLDRRDISKVTNKLGTSAGLTSRFSPHVGRHTFARNLILNGATIEFVASELGHAELDTTKIYTRLGVRDPRVKEMYERFMR